MIESTCCAISDSFSSNLLTHAAMFSGFERSKCGGGCCKLGFFWFVVIVAADGGGGLFLSALTLSDKYVWDVSTDWVMSTANCLPFARASLSRIPVGRWFSFWTNFLRSSSRSRENSLASARSAVMCAELLSERIDWSVPYKLWSRRARIISRQGSVICFDEEFSVISKHIS